MQAAVQYKKGGVSSRCHSVFELQLKQIEEQRKMKSFALLCFLLFASACVFGMYIFFFYYKVKLS